MNDKKSNKTIFIAIGCGVLLLVGLICSGILAVVAIPAFSKYITQSKVSEASLNLKTIADSAAIYHSEHKAFPKSTDLTPSTPCCDKCLPDSKIWDQKGWKDAQFSIERPHYYRYKITTEGNSCTIEAIGDLDCDGIESNFTIKLSADSDDEVSITPVYMPNPINELE